METYSTLRHFADSWMLLFMVLFFVGVIFWTFRPGARKQQRDAASSIFRHEDKPIPVDDTAGEERIEHRADRGTAKESVI